MQKNLAVFNVFLFLHLKPDYWYSKFCQIKLKVEQRIKLQLSGKFRSSWTQTQVCF